MATVREATIGDLEGLVELWLSLRAESAEPPTPELTRVRTAALRDYFTRYLGTDIYAWIAETSYGHLVACGGLVIHRRSPTSTNLSGLEGYLLNMYTRPEARGQGLGTAILQAAIARAHDVGARRIRLDASEVGRPLYAKAGFRPVSSAMQLDW